MKEPNELKNYRYKYKRYYGIEFSKDFDVHHIDFNRENNDISNLILLPKKLHRKYHMLGNMLFGSGDGQISKTHTQICLYNVVHTSKTLEEFAKTMQEMKEWVVYKNDLEVERRVKQTYGSI